MELQVTERPSTQITMQPCSEAVKVCSKHSSFSTWLLSQSERLARLALLYSVQHWPSRRHTAVQARVKAHCSLNQGFPKSDGGGLEGSASQGNCLISLFFSQPGGQHNERMHKNWIWESLANSRYDADVMTTKTCTKIIYTTIFYIFNRCWLYPQPSIHCWLLKQWQILQLLSIRSKRRKNCDVVTEPQSLQREEVEMAG